MDERLLGMGTATVQEEDSSDEHTALLQSIASSTRRAKLPPGSTSVVGAVFIVINASLGAGLLAFPFAFFSAGGWEWGLIIQLALLSFIVFGLLVLAWVSEWGGASTYEGVVSAVLGRGVRVVAEACIALYCFGTCITFLVVIGDQIDSISAVAQSHNASSPEPPRVQWWLDRRFTITVASVLFILPWMWLRNIGVLSYTSFIGVISCVYIALVVTVKYFTLNRENPCVVVTDACPRSWPDAFNAIPFICFGYQCHISSVPIYAGLKQRSLRSFSVVLAVGLTICVLVYSATGVFGYLTFAGHTCLDSDILKNYCPGDIAVDVARAVLAVVIITSYPILAFCGRTAVDSLLMRVLGGSRAGRLLRRHEAARLRVEGTVWFFLALPLALFVPQISYVINPIGGLAAAFILIFPGMCVLSLVLRSPRLAAWRPAALLAAAICGIVLGAFIFGNSLTYSLLKDVGVIK